MALNIHERAMQNPGSIFLSLGIQASNRLGPVLSELLKST